MAEYKYRALGWQDDDIASLNVIDGTAADNQVELQITKQGEGGTIDGPAIKGADGITIDATDPNTVKISGSGLVQKDTTPARVIYAHSPDGSPLMLYPQTGATTLSEWWLPTYRPATEGDTVSGSGVLLTNTPTKDFQCANKKFVEDAIAAGGGTSVIANPTLSGSEAALSALQIGDTKYRIEGSLTTLMVGIDSSLLGG